LVPLRGDLHVRDVRYEIIKGTDFDGHHAPSDEQGGVTKIIKGNARVYPKLPERPRAFRAFSEPVKEEA
jgi:hypothetical protein